MFFFKHVRLLAAWLGGWSVGPKMAGKLQFQRSYRSTYLFLVALNGHLLISAAYNECFGIPIELTLLVYHFILVRFFFLGW